MEFAKPCLLRLSCPGDDGNAVVYWKRAARRVKKDDPVIKLFGALDTAFVYVHKAANICRGRRPGL